MCELVCEPLYVCVCACECVGVCVHVCVYVGEGRSEGEPSCRLGQWLGLLPDHQFVQQGGWGVASSGPSRGVVQVLTGDDQFHCKLEPLAGSQHL